MKSFAIAAMIAAVAAASPALAKDTNPAAPSAPAPSADATPPPRHIAAITLANVWSVSPQDVICIDADQPQPADGKPCKRRLEWAKQGTRIVTR